MQAVRRSSLEFVLGTRASAPSAVARRPTRVMGLPILPVTLKEAVDEIDRIIQTREPRFVITANANFAMLAASDARVQAAAERAAFVVADGAPLLWAARRQGAPLPERVSGSDLVPALCRRAARKDYGVFFLGGLASTARTAARNVCREYSDLRVVGVASPIIHADKLDEALLAQIRAARPDLLFASLSQPKGELWLSRHCRRLGVPMSIQVGATFDFLAGQVPRAPCYLQHFGLEWAYRLKQEPRRLAWRYWQNAMFLARSLGNEVLHDETCLGVFPKTLSR